MPRTFVVRSTPQATTRGKLQHGCPLKKASIAETVQVSTQNREIGCCCSKTLSLPMRRCSFPQMAPACTLNVCDNGDQIKGVCQIESPRVFQLTDPMRG